MGIKNHRTNPKTNIIITRINIFLYSLIKSISIKQKYIINARIIKLLSKKIDFFSSQSMRMSGNKINFDDKKIKESDFYNKMKTYLILMILMLIKNQSLKKNNMANIIHLNTLLAIITMMLLDHYI